MKGRGGEGAAQASVVCIRGSERTGERAQAVQRVGTWLWMGGATVSSLALPPLGGGQFPPPFEICARRRRAAGALMASSSGFCRGSRQKDSSGFIHLIRPSPSCNHMKTLCLCRRRQMPYARTPASKAADCVPSVCSRLHRPGSHSFSLKQLGKFSAGRNG